MAAEDFQVASGNAPVDASISASEMLVPGSLPNNKIAKKVVHYKSPPCDVIAVAIAWIVVLPALAYAYQHWAWLHSAVPDPAGPIPLGVAWWGALGGLSISLIGIVGPTHAWQDRFRLWHYVRPLLGAISGSVGYLIVFGLFQAAGTAPKMSGAHAIVFDTIAFLIGFREEMFWQLITKAVDLILQPATPSNNTSGSTTAHQEISENEMTDEST